MLVEGDSDIVPTKILVGTDGSKESLTDLTVLLLWGDRDRAFREEEHARFERVFPKHRTVVFRGAGHYIQEDAADEIVTEITRWSS